MLPHTLDLLIPVTKDCYGLREFNAKMVNLQSHRRFLAEVKLRQSHRYGDLGDDPGFAPSWANYSAEEETIRNDYSERYLAGYGHWPSHCILGARDEELCEE
jgi:hypothetical protein